VIGQNIKVHSNINTLAATGILTHPKLDKFKHYVCV